MSRCLALAGAVTASSVVLGCAASGAAPSALSASEERQAGPNDEELPVQLYPAQIEPVVTEAYAKIKRDCWLHSQPPGGSSSARVHARVWVQPDGRVGDVVIGATPSEYPKLKWCIGNVLWKLRFAKSQRPTSVAVALAFDAP